MDERAFLEGVALALVKGLGDSAVKKLVDELGSAGSVFAAGEEKLMALGGLKPGVARAVARGPELDRAGALVDEAAKKGCWLTHYGAESYPAVLPEIYDPPSLLFGKGALVDGDKRAVAIVGSRKSTSHGRRLASEIAGELASLGITVVSGLALGIDGAAHLGALEAGGRTVAVLGSGIDVIYPARHGKLFGSITGAGAVITEQRPGVSPLAGNFPRRNRIISGLSAAVVVVEAAERSGSLITARMALEQGRDVLAAPGLAGSSSARGSNGLIRQGAKLIEKAGDVIEELPWVVDAGDAEAAAEGDCPAPGIDGDLLKMWELLEEVPLEIDALVRKGSFSPQAAAAALMELELLGYSVEWPGKRYSRKTG